MITQLQTIFLLSYSSSSCVNKQQWILRRKQKSFYNPFCTKRLEFNSEGGSKKTMAKQKIPESVAFSPGWQNEGTFWLCFFPSPPIMND